MHRGEFSKPYLAFDLGAESGRAVLAHFHSGVLTTEEVHRFPNEPVEYSGSLHWDVARLWCEMRKALTKLEDFELGGIGVDAWGVDYALLGERGELLQNPYHYRDRRTVGVMAEVFRKVPKEEIDQYFVSALRGKARHSDNSKRGVATAHDPGPVPLLAHGTGGVRVHKRDHHSTRESDHAYLGCRVDEASRPAVSSPCGDR